MYSEKNIREVIKGKFLPRNSLERMLRSVTCKALVECIKLLLDQPVEKIYLEKIHI